MNANDYQLKAIRTGGTTTTRDRILNAALGLSGEAGEVADLVKKWMFHGHTLDVENLSKELGDLQWYVAQMATALGLDLEDIMQENLDKLAARYPNGFNSADSLNRKE